MARIESVEFRLLNWARWRLSRGGGALGYARVQLGASSNAGRSGYVETPIPISDVCAAETDGCIDRLNPPGLKLTVVQVYTGRGGLADHARVLYCSERAVHARIDQAHRQLFQMFLELQERRRRDHEDLQEVLARARRR